MSRGLFIFFLFGSVLFAIEHTHSYAPQCAFARRIFFRRHSLTVSSLLAQPCVASSFRCCPPNGFDFSRFRSTSPLRTHVILPLSDFPEVSRTEGPRDDSLLGLS